MSDITFRYFYGSGADMHTFYRIPKQLMTDPYFKELSSDAKILYGLMLDRMSLSIKNGWLDEENRAYIYFSVEEIMEYMPVGRNKALGLLAALDTASGIGLIERVKQGQGKPSKIYVRDFVMEDKNPEVYNLNFKKFKNQTSRSPESKRLEVYESNPNYNDINNTENNNISNLILSTSSDEHSETENEPYNRKNRSEGMGYVQLVNENIEWDILRERYPFDQEVIDGIYDLLVEAVLARGKTMVIARNEYDTELVRRKLLRLDTGHIEYVMRGLKNNTTKIVNIKKYLLAALFNAPSTIGGYYQAAVNCV